MKCIKLKYKTILGFRMIRSLLKLACIVAITFHGAAYSQEIKKNELGHLIVDDAERFAELFRKSEGDLTAELLQSDYIDVGTEGISIFTPYRIVNSQNLAKNIASAQADYQKAIDICLPAAKQVESKADVVLKKVASLLGESNVAPAYILFGANNSGGTADHKGLVIGLEVICQFADGEDDVVNLIEEFLAHEIVHVYQARNNMYRNDVRPSLLEVSILEGFASFIMEKVLGRESIATSESSNYGQKHEAMLWQEFQKDIIANNGYGDWLYNQKPDNGRPADLGYWIGKRISEEYYAIASNKTLALRQLLKLDDATAILEASGYGKEL